MTFWANSNICNSLAHGQWLYFLFTQYLTSVFHFKKLDKYIHIYMYMTQTLTSYHFSVEHFTVFIHIPKFNYAIEYFKDI